MAQKIPFLHAYSRKNPNWETQDAAAFFEKAVCGRVSYEEMSRHGDWFAYVSAQVLAIILPQILDEYLLRNDRDNYLIYPILRALDPTGCGKDFLLERFKEMEPLIDQSTKEKICLFLERLSDDLPISEEHFDRVRSYWNRNVPQKPICGPQP